MPKYFIFEHLVNNEAQAWLLACPHMHVPDGQLCVNCPGVSNNQFTYTTPLYMRTKPLHHGKSKVDKKSNEKLKTLAPGYLRFMTRPMTDSYRPLHDAVLLKDWKLVYALILMGVDRNSLWWSMYNTPLHEAVGNNLTVDIPVRIVQMLITPLNINMINELGQTPLLMALSRRQAHIVLELLQSGADVDQMVGGHTPLHLMINTGQWNLASLLIQNGADVNIQCKGHGNTALHYAVVKTWQCDMSDSYLKALKMLITPTNINMANKRGFTALHLLVGKEGLGGVKGIGAVKMVEELLAGGADVDSMQCDMTPLQQALESGAFDAATVLLQHGADVNIQSKRLYGFTALHIVVKYSRLDINFLKQFITPININAKCDMGYTPLQYALQYHVTWPVITELIHSGADVNINTIYMCSCWPNDYDEHDDEKDVEFENLTPLMLITKVLHVLMDTPWQVLRHLVTPQTINFQDSHGCTALHNTIKCRNWRVACYLLKKGADINIRCNQGLTPLHLAVRNMPSEYISKFISAANINAIDNDGWTPLNKATYSGRWDVVQELLRHKADVNIPNNYLQPPFITALIPKSPPISNDLLYRLFPENVNLPIRDDKMNCKCDSEHVEETAEECFYRNCTPVVAAAWDERWNMVKQFLVRGADFTTLLADYTFCDEMIIQLKYAQASPKPKSLQQICASAIRTELKENDRRTEEDYCSLGLPPMLTEYVRLGQDIAEELIDIYDGEQYEAPV